MPAIDQTNSVTAIEPHVVDIYAAGDSIEAHAAAAVLRNAGIDVQVVGGGLDSIKGGIPFGESTAPRLWVARADAQRAEQLLSQWQSELSKRRSTKSAGAFPYGVKPIFIGLIAMNILLRVTEAVSGDEFSSLLSMIAGCLLSGYFLFVVYYHAKHRNVGNDQEDS